MDTWTVPLIFASFFLSASLCLILVYKYGIKSKSYEEAVAEHRRQTNALLASSKPKLKEKKNKKVAKKFNKEKSNDSEKLPKSHDEISTFVVLSEGNDEISKINLVSNTNSNNKKQITKPFEDNKKVNSESVLKIKKHTELKNNTIDISPKKVVENKFKINTNHKESKNVRDSLELRSSTTIQSSPIIENNNSSENAVKIKEQNAVLEQHSNKNNGKQLQNYEFTDHSNKEHIHAVEIKDIEKLNKLNTVSIKKKKKKENDNVKYPFDTNVDHLKEALYKSELTRTELQELIELLLNKQQESPTVITDDWSEGKSDPIQKLKKQLAEKEQTLADEQNIIAGLQAKLKQIRNEYAIEKANLKASESSKLEIIAANNRLQKNIQELDEKYKTQMQILFEEKNAMQMQRDNAMINFQKNDSVIQSLTNEAVHVNNELQLLSHKLQEALNDKQQYVQGFSKFQEEIISIQTALHDEREAHQLAIVKHLEEKNVMTGEIQRLTNFNCGEEQRRRLEISQLENKYAKLQEEHEKIAIDEKKRYESEISNLKNELLIANEKHHNLEICYKREMESVQQKYQELQIALNDEKANVKELSSKLISTEHNEQKYFLQQLFPAIANNLNSISNTDLWRNEYKHLIEEYLSGLHQSKTEEIKEENHLETVPTVDAYDDEVQKLRGEVRHYKNIIEDTENILKKLESHIANEEHQWKMQIAQKDKEIEELKHKNNGKLQGKLAYLKNQLEREQYEKQQLLAERNHNKLLETTSNNKPNIVKDDADLNNDKGPSTSKASPSSVRNKESTMQSNADYYQNGTNELM